MTKTLISTPIVVPEAVRRKAGIRRGEALEFKVSGRAITIVRKLTPDELEDEIELQDLVVQQAIRESNADIAAGRTSAADLLLSPISKVKRPSARKR